ncbi:Hypothetical predicted protein [Olea europaea subsp. europaea]|uniref:Uncharacterized protein n=1 Tax=Olea europaea subsp. europaea TaxID=158383 RepID=A0A8S0UFX8_OLEEU|nr:Hypothetical predicted protein [Olea europaea subsp. europaea]
MEQELQNLSTATEEFSDGIDSCCSTPYVSAPSSPGRVTSSVGGFYYSAPSSPMHFVTNLISVSSSGVESSPSFEFDFSAQLATNGGGDSESPESMCSADELFLNGQIRPLKLSTHLQRPQVLFHVDEINDVEHSVLEDDEKLVRGRDLKFRTGSRRTRSMSPLRTTSLEWYEDEENAETKRQNEESKHEALGLDETPASASASESSSRTSSVGRKWIFLKEFLYRSKSEGRNNSHKFWGSLSFSPSKDKKMTSIRGPEIAIHGEGKKKEVKKKASNGVGKRRVPPSPHELHYTAKRAQAEEMKKKTFLPYRQGLLGCMGFSSKSYSAMNGFARALNPVSSS